MHFSGVEFIYKYTSKQIRLPGDFFLPFGGKLNSNNRWIILSTMIPWEEFEDEYAKNFKKSKRGEVAYNVRIALGSLIIKERLGLSDEETVNQISENLYLQFFLGFESYTEKAPCQCCDFVWITKQVAKSIDMVDTHI